MYQITQLAARVRGWAKSIPSTFGSLATEKRDDPEVQAFIEEMLEITDRHGTTAAKEVQDTLAGAEDIIQCGRQHHVLAELDPERYVEEVEGSDGFCLAFLPPPMPPGSLYHAATVAKSLLGYGVNHMNLITVRTQETEFYAGGTKFFINCEGILVPEDASSGVWVLSKRAEECVTDLTGLDAATLSTLRVQAGGYAVFRKTNDGAWAAAVYP